MQNRRNLYRLLHVQRDAPPEVIKSSYRTLMQTLRQHPDLGGDEWNARLLNEAKRILCDPLARAHYDDSSANPAGSTSPPRSRRTDEPQAPGPSGTPSAGAAEASPAPPDDRAAPGAATTSDGPCCHYCQASVPAPTGRRTGYASADRCRRCGAPTCPVPAMPGGHGEGERRALHRMTGGAEATILRHWPLNEHTHATMLEFSTAGCAFESAVEFFVADVVLLRTAVLTAAGTVRSCDPVPGGDTRRIGIEFLSVAMHTATGQIFSASA